VLLFTAADHARVASGAITLTFRLWKRAHVKAGKTYRSGFGGWIEVLEVDVLPAALVSDADAGPAGCASAAEVLRLAGEHTRTAVTNETLLHRVRFRYLPDVPQEPAEIDIAGARARLQRMDAPSRQGPWALATLRLIASRPGLRARDLMALAGRDDLTAFKADVRKLKGIGLTRSLIVGYELTDAGRAVLESA
jgi:hypothetical protein